MRPEVRLQVCRLKHQMHTVRLICQHIKDFYRLDPYLLRCYDSALEEVDASFGGPSNA